MYRHDFVTAIKCRGKFLREKEDNTVYLPFGSEYSILLKNLSSKKASVKVEIDGEDVLRGRSLIVDPHSEVELERYIKSDLDRGNRFKFIKKTEEISRYRGDRLGDGLVRVRYRFEKPFQYIKIKKEEDNPWVTPIVTWGDYTTPNVTYSSNPVIYGNPASGSSCSNIEAKNETSGITVPGSISEQQFYYGSIGDLGEEYIITLQLKGGVSRPLTVKSKVTCQTCGKKSRSSNKFCPNCGTSLKVI